jgi:hypothetical protein
LKEKELRIIPSEKNDLCLLQIDNHDIKKITTNHNTDNKVHKLVMVFAICSCYLDSEPVTL